MLLCPLGLFNDTPTVSKFSKIHETFLCWTAKDSKAHVMTKEADCQCFLLLLISQNIFGNEYLQHRLQVHGTVTT